MADDEFDLEREIAIAKREIHACNTDAQLESGIADLMRTAYRAGAADALRSGETPPEEQLRDIVQAEWLKMAHGDDPNGASAAMRVAKAAYVLGQATIGTPAGETPPAVVGPLSAIRRQIELRKKVLVEDEWPQLETTGGLSFAKGRLFELEMVLAVLGGYCADRAVEAGDRRSDLLRQIAELPVYRMAHCNDMGEDYMSRCYMVAEPSDGSAELMAGQEEWLRVADVRRVLAETPEAQHACAKCGVLRTKAEGGTVFTVCDRCWPLETPLSLADRLQVGIQATDEIAERLTKFAAPPRAPQEPTDGT